MAKKKLKPGPGPEPERLIILGDWKKALGRAVRKKRPKKGRPKAKKKPQD